MARFNRACKEPKAGIKGHGPRAKGPGGACGNGPKGRAQEARLVADRGGANGFRIFFNGPRGPWPKASVSERIFRGHSELSLKSTKQKHPLARGITRAQGHGPIPIELAAKTNIDLAALDNWQWRSKAA